MSKPGHAPDYILVSIVFILTTFGLAMLASTSSYIGVSRFGDPYYFLKNQLLHGFLPGLIFFLIASKLYYKNFKKVALFFLMVSIIGLILVFTPFGASFGGAARWIAFGPITIQPAEIMKLTFIIYVAAWLSNVKMNRQNKLAEGFLPFIGISGVVGLLLLLQPATSTVAVLLAAALIVYFISGAKIRYILFVVLLGALSLMAIVAATPYRMERMRSFINPTVDTQGSAFHFNQLQITVGSGGLWGVGYGNSTGKNTYLPEPIGDSIFAVFAEEFGFVGVVVLGTLFLSLVLRAFLLARKCRDEFGRLLLVGFGSLIGIQAFIHIGANIGFIPLTGIPLPFISFGGTALAMFLAISGIMINVSKYI